MPLSKPPNILLIMADQMAAPALPVYGHRVVKSPHLSALADSGILFENAYCNSPLCAPSRASMLTGLLPSHNGAYDNAADFPASLPTVAHHLRRQGYDTCLCGKMHLIGPDQLHGFEERLTTDIYPADYGWTPDWDHPHDRPSWYHNMLSIVQAGLCQTSNQLDFDEEVAFHAGRKLYELARRADAGPFFLTVSFTHPHDPFAITREYWDRYEDAEIDLPAAAPIPVAQMDPHSQRLHHVCDLGRYRQTKERVRAARHAYYAEISYVDDKVGQLVRVLDDTGLRDDTVVVFTSDHGEMLGERGLWYKMSFFEWSARVPLIFSAPRRFRPGRISEPVSLVDLLPTIVELAGGVEALDPAGGLDGHSLAPRLCGQPAADPHPVVGEILFEGVIAPCFMIREGRYKYVFSEPDPEQLFDLESDPHELTNLATHPAFDRVRLRFRDEIERRWDRQAIHRQVLDSQRRRSLVYQALISGQRTSWDYQPLADASEQYMRGHMDLDSLERRARFPTPPVPEPDRLGQADTAAGHR